MCVDICLNPHNVHLLLVLSLKPDKCIKIYAAVSKDSTHGDWFYVQVTDSVTKQILSNHTDILFQSSWLDVCSLKYGIFCFNLNAPLNCCLIFLVLMHIDFVGQKN